MFTLILWQRLILLFYVCQLTCQSSAHWQWMYFSTQLPRYLSIQRDLYHRKSSQVQILPTWHLTYRHPLMGYSTWVLSGTHLVTWRSTLQTTSYGQPCILSRNVVQVCSFQMLSEIASLHVYLLPVPPRLLSTVRFFCVRPLTDHNNVNYNFEVFVVPYRLGGLIRSPPHGKENSPSARTERVDYRALLKHTVWYGSVLKSFCWNFRTVQLCECPRMLIMVVR